jgi:hypothetical protein
MTPNRKTQEPDRPLSVLVFPKTGRPYMRVEHPPRDQKELEFALGRKFIGALAHFQGIRLSKLTICPASEEPGDLICVDEKGRAIKIQVAELIDHSPRRLKEMRGSYVESIRNQYGNVFVLFSGCRVSLVDSGEEPYLPHIHTSQGQECLRKLVTELESFAYEIGALAINRMRTRNIQISKKRIGVVCIRFASAGKDVPFQFAWDGGGPPYRKDVSRRLLYTTVTGKVEKHYSKPTEPFWLLTYSTDTLFDEQDPDIEESRHLLDSTRHPLDAVWYLYPYTNEELGHVLRVWLNQQNEIRT